MAYSGIAVATGLGLQRVGFARSDDLMSWRRSGPVVEADPRWYECGEGTAETHWRDPWLWRDEAGVLHAYVTARSNDGPEDGRGVIGHAWRLPSGAWEVGPLVSVPGELRQLEVPQLLETAPGRWAILACCRWSDHSAVRRSRPGAIAETGTLALEGASALGPFVVPPGRFLDGTPEDRRYAGRIVELRGRRWLLAWIDRREDGSFAGELGDPVPVEVDAEGRLRVVSAHRP
jgi:beta-fructofuranosidase